MRQNDQTPNYIDKKKNKFLDIMEYNDLLSSVWVFQWLQTSKPIISFYLEHKLLQKDWQQVYLIIVYLSLFSLIGYSSKIVHKFVSKYILLEVHHVSRIIHINWFSVLPFDLEPVDFIYKGCFAGIGAIKDFPSAGTNKSTLKNMTKATTCNHRKLLTETQEKYTAKSCTYSVRYAVPHKFSFQHLKEALSGY